MVCDASGQLEVSNRCAAMGDCQEAGCNASSGMCMSKPKTRGEACGSRFCDGMGGCTLECTNDSQCKPMSECYVASCGSAGTCQNKPKPKGERCGSMFCDANGGCKLECFANTDCRGADQKCDTATNKCVAIPLCENGRADPDENCDPKSTPFASHPEVCNSNCKLIDAVYDIDCNNPGQPAWPGAWWTCTNVGNPTIECANNPRACATASGKGQCLLFGKAPNQGSFCAIPCSLGCPTGLSCRQVPDGPSGGVCGNKEFSL
jgi:hypothetical protein